MDFKLKMKLALGSAVAGAVALIPSVSATQVLANDTLYGLPSAGEQIGGFLTGLTPGLTGFMLIMAVISGVIGILGALVVVIKGKFTSY